MEDSIFTPASKKQRVDFFDINTCVLCEKTFTEINGPVVPDTTRIQSLFRASLERKDEIAKKLLDHKTEILNGQISIRYHRGCRSTYTSAYHIDLHNTKAAACSNTDTNDYEKPEVLQNQSLFTRSQSAGSTFDWKRNCFICDKMCHPNSRYTTDRSWSMVETVTENSKNSSLYFKVLKAAEDRGDNEMMARLHGVPNSDLVACEARYHKKKNCLAHYIDPLHIARKRKASMTQSLHEATIGMVISEFSERILEGKEVIPLESLRKRFQELGQENGIENPESYSTQNLKKQLIKTWKDITFVSHKGLPDLVCSKAISADDAVREAHTFTKELTDSEINGDNLTMNTNLSDESIVYTAMGILRRKMKNTKKLENEYYSSTEMSLDAAVDFIDPLLYKAIQWLGNEEAYNTGSNVANEEVQKRCLSIACDITTLNTKVISPKHLGLSVHLYHEYGSRKLIEDMHALGYGISYTELRQFLTSAAVHIGTKSETLPSGALVQPELLSKGQGGKLILAAGDNWDHNERTPDGKNTTHAMTSILVTQQQEEHDSTFPRIQRSADRSYDCRTLPGGDLTKVLHYQKPSCRPEPPLQPHPKVEEIKPDHNSLDVKRFQLTELVYHLGRNHPEAEESLPPWGPFHVLLHQKSIPLSVISYSPILMAPPTDYNTIFTTLLRNKEIISNLGYEHLPIFFDMGLLTKALEITWARPHELSGVYPCEGGMHLLMAVLAAIGHLYGGAGLDHLLFDSGVFAAGTTQQILSGRDFDRGIYAMKLVDEVLHALFLQEFGTWCEEKGITLPTEINNLMSELQQQYDSSSPDPHEAARLVDDLSKVIEQQLLPLLGQFRQVGRATSETFVLWDDFLQRVSLPLKMFLASTRKADWSVYQSTKAEFLPLLFAGNRTTYARYMPVLLMLMNRLPNEVTQAFAHSGFIAKLSDGKFNGVWIDYALEATENKALKGSGGIIGLTLRGPALARWFLARPVTARYSTTFHDSIHDSTGKDSKELQHHSQRKSEVKRWNTNVAKMTNLFDTGSFINPFKITDLPAGLVNFATGAVAPEEVQRSLVGALDEGTSLAETFVKERLVGSDGKPPTKSFYDPMKRASIKTMSSLNKSVKVKSTTVSVPGEAMYLRLLAINHEKKVPLERVMAFENAAVPLSMFTDEGLMLTGKKSIFLQKLENLIQRDTIHHMSSADAIIFDANAILHILKVPGRENGEISYAEMASSFLRYLLATSRKTCETTESQIHAVFDRYFPESAKNATRQKRSRGYLSSKYHVTPEAQVPKDWKLFLTRDDNKASLASCFTNQFKASAKNHLKPGEKLYISGGHENLCHLISNDQPEDVGEDQECHELKSNHEEADTRIVSHAIHAAQNGAKTIVVQSPDTDVLILLLHHRAAIQAEQIFFATGHDGKHASLKRFIPVHTLYELLTSSQMAIMLPIYCLTGCDTVSFFFGHGKATAFQLMKKHADQFQALQSLGSGKCITKEEKVACNKFVSMMYGHQSESLNSVRCKMAKSQKKQIVGKKLPPTEDSFLLHIKRTVYQLLIWKQAHLTMMEIPDPKKYGYEFDTNNHMSAKMMEQEVSAPELLNDFLCGCSGEDCKTTSHCVCFKYAQPCTAACLCKAASLGLNESNTLCTNPFTIEALLPDSDTDSD